MEGCTLGLVPTRSVGRDKDQGTIADREDYGWRWSMVGTQSGARDSKLAAT